MNAIIEAQIVTTDPLHVTAPEKDASYNIANGRVVYGQRAKGLLPLTQTRKMSFAEKARVEGRSRLSVPVIPANTLRGGLRREIAQFYFDEALRQGKKLSLDAFHVLTCGAPHGHPDQFTSVADIQRYLAHMYFGLLGGGPKLGATSQLKVRTGYPVCPATADQSVVPLVQPKVLAELQAAETDWLTDIYAIPRKDEACSSSVSVAARKVVANLETAVEALETALKGKKKSGEDEDDDSSRGLNGLNFIEAVVPKTPFLLRFEVQDAQEYNLGLLLLGLQKLLQKTIGGKASVGMGSIAVTQFAVQIDGEKVTPPTPAPETWGAWFDEDGPVGMCVQAAKEELANLDTAELEDMCHPAQIGKKKEA